MQPFPDTIDSLLKVDPESGAAFQYDRYFEFLKHGTRWELSIELGDSPGAGSMHEEEAEMFTEQEGEIAIAMGAGGVVASGVIESADIIEDELIIAVNDPVQINADEIEIEQ